ncbi:PIG-L family deacetylase [Rickettsiales bacterium]|nr:PIG-L family deacetylase [Rickettsiales bacterium]
MKNILILAPHPDDETVGLSVFIKRKQEEGCNFFIFFLTNGVVSKNEMWFWEKNKYDIFLDKRLNEMRDSLNFFKIKDYFLQNIPTRHLKNYIKQTFIKIKSIIKNQTIDSIFVPAYEGGHQDHDVANFIASKFVKKINVFEYSEYHNYRDKIHSNSFINKIGNETLIELNKNEVAYKKKSLLIYKSERKNLNYIKTKREVYRPIIRYNYHYVPHTGTLFYKRFGIFSWHPRVDSTDPKEVCKIINTYKYLDEI